MKKEDLSNLQVFDKMVNDGNAGIKLATTIVDSYTVSQGGVICFGVERSISDDASFQKEFGLLGTNMLLCFSVNRKEFEKTKSDLMNSSEKRYFVRESYNTAFKNILDVELRAAFSGYVNNIITQNQLDQFTDLHKKTSDNYYEIVRGKCKPIDYKTSFEGSFTPTSSRKNHTVFVTDGYWLELIEVIE